jgi:hypothetical protein
MKLVDNDEGLGQAGIDSITVWLPHVHSYATDALPVVKPHQIVSDKHLAPVWKKVENGIVFNIREDATGLFDDMDFVNAHPFRGFKDGCSFQFHNVFIEHASDSALRNANITGYAGKGLVDGLLAYPAVKAGGHALPVDNIREPFCQCLSAVPATEAASLDIDTYSLAVHREVFNQYLLPSAAYYVLRTAGKAGLGRGRGFSVQVIFMVVFFGGKDVVSRQVENVFHFSNSKGGDSKATIPLVSWYSLNFHERCYIRMSQKSTIVKICILNDFVFIATHQASTALRRKIIPPIFAMPSFSIIGYVLRNRRPCNDIRMTRESGVIPPDLQTATTENLNTFSLSLFNYTPLSILRGLFINIVEFHGSSLLTCRVTIAAKPIAVRPIYVKLTALGAFILVSFVVKIRCVVSILVGGVIFVSHGVPPVCWLSTTYYYLTITLHREHVN